MLKTTWQTKLFVSIDKFVFSLGVRLVLQLHHDCTFMLSNALISSILHCKFLSGDGSVDVKINWIRL